MKGNSRASTKTTIEHKGNLQILRQMGWIAQRGNRQTPKMIECDLQSDEVLFGMRKDLVQQCKDREAFLEMVFGSRDRVWVDRCSSIIAEY